MEAECDFSVSSFSLSLVHGRTGAWLQESRPFVHCPRGLWVVERAAVLTKARFRKSFSYLEGNSVEVVLQKWIKHELFLRKCVMVIW